MTDARIDGNSRQAITAVSSADGNTIVRPYVDPTSHRLLVDIIGGGTTTVDVGTTTTLAPGSSATVVNSGTTTNAIFDFGIPAGVQGNQGIQGVQGNPGTNGTNGTNAIILDTSSTSTTIGTGSKTFTVGSATNSWAVGEWLIIASRANQANYMTGPITNYTGTSVTVNVIAIGGSGTFTDWNVSLSGVKGADGTGTVTTVSVATANGFSGSVANATTTPAITIVAGAITPTSVNGLTLASQAIGFTIAGGTTSKTLTVPLDASVSGTNTGDQTITLTGNVSGSGTGSFAATIATSVALAGSPTTTTQTASDNSTKIATTAFTQAAIANAIAGVDPAISVIVATTAAADTSGLTYNNGVAGVGATFTGSNNTALTFDGVTLTSLNQRVLVKNDTQSPSGAFNGVYYLTQLQTTILPPILTRSLDYNTPNSINYTGVIPVLSGTVNALTSWLINTTVVTVGTTPITYTQFSYNPSRVIPANLGGTGIANNAASTLTVSGNYGTTLTVSNTTAVTLPTTGTLATLAGSEALTNKSLNGMTVTASTGTFTLTNAKTLSVSDTTTLATNAITLGGGEVVTFSASNALSLLTTGTTAMTFPAVTDTVAVLGTAQTYTATMTEKQVVWSNNAITASGNAATVPITSRLNTVTNNSAATLTITMTTTSAVDGQMSMVRILDASAAAQTITWVNTENSTVTAPTTSNGSTTLFLTVGFIYNAGTSKWRCIASA